MTRPLGALGVERFLGEHWQRAPCLLRGAFPELAFPLDGNDLAGLACEPLAESRLVTGPDPGGHWTLRHGPFEESVFDTLGDADWTLLVQDVEKHYPPLRELLTHFAFLPGWRLDDLMLSFAAPGGSVGPHVDQYDVFLLQVEGRRQWQIAREFDPARRDDVPLDMLAGFEAEEEWVLGPGDMLYLPPGVAHHGVALDACLTCSVGFRAPSAADLFLALGEWLADQPGEGGRYTDPPLSSQAPAGEIDAAALARFRELLSGPLDDAAAFGPFIAAFLSRFRQAHEPVAPPGGTPDANALVRHLAAGGGFEAHPWARFGWVNEGQQARLFASGEGFLCSKDFATWVCGGLETTPPTLETPDRHCLEAMVRGGQLLVSQG